MRIVRRFRQRIAQKDRVRIAQTLGKFPSVFRIEREDSSLRIAPTFERRIAREESMRIAEVLGRWFA